MSVTQPDASAFGHGYRPDIDGLRAIAVLSVLFFHLGVSPFQGGFVGVDIFFVISGYLITKNIFSQLEQGNFSLSDFYVRRVRRIFPALYVTVLATLLAAWFLLERHELRPLMDACRSLAIFLSNQYFMRAGGYFDAPLEANAVLQTWSLSVEEQYYLGFPLLMLLLHRHLRRYLSAIVVAIAFTSFAVACIQVNVRPEKAFFATEARIYELMIGAIVALGILPRLENAVLREALGWIGVFAMALSVVMLSPDIPFPGLSALPVCVGAMLVIWTGERGVGTSVRTILAWQPLVGIGLISYSVYLIHWPLVVFAKRFAAGDLSSLQKAAIVVVALAAGYASWRYIERPWRHPADGEPRPARQVFAVATALIAVLAVGSTGATRAFLTLPKAIAEEFENHRRAALREPCLLGVNQQPVDWRAEACVRKVGTELFAIWGDSYAAHYFEALRALAKKEMVGTAAFAYAGCPPIVGANINKKSNCASFNKLALETILSLKPKVVVLSAHWLNYEKHRSFPGANDDILVLLQSTIDQLQRSGTRVVMIGPSPYFPATVPSIAMAKNGPAGEGLAPARYSKLFDAFFRKLAAVGAIEHVPAYAMFCNTAALCRFRDHDNLLFWDNGHLTSRGAALVVDSIAPQFAKYFQQR